MNEDQSKSRRTWPYSNLDGETRNAVRKLEDSAIKGYVMVEGESFTSYRQELLERIQESLNATPSYGEEI